LTIVKERFIYGPAMGTKTDTRKNSLYHPSLCSVVISMASQGKSEAEWALYGCGVSRSTMKRWATEHPEFCDALEIAYDASLAWWEANGQLNLKRKEFNTPLYSKIISSRFRREYGEKIVLSGDEDAPLITRVQRVIVKPKHDRRD
jgi:hypothetical protein